MIYQNSFNWKTVSFFRISVTFLVLLSSSIHAFGQNGEFKAGNPSLSQIVSIAGKSSGSISKQEMLQAKKLVMKSPADTAFHVSSFMMTRVRKGQPPIEIRNNLSGELNESMLELAETLMTGDKVYFEYIKIRYVDGTTRSLGALSFVVE